jgi:hypothetical protein
MGFYGAECTELSAVTYLFVSQLALVTIYACLTFHTSAKHAVAIYGGNLCRMISSAGGRAIMFSALLSISMVLNSLLTSLYALKILRDSGFMQFILVVGYGLCALSFIGATLSVSVVWFQMADKARVHGGAPQKSFMYPGFTVSAISFAGMVLMVLVYGYLRSSSGVGISAVAFMGMLSLTYHVAGRRVAAVLHIPRGENPSLAAQQTQVIANKVRETAFFMSRALAALAVMFLCFSFSIPSQRPLYNGQNQIRRLFAGQVLLTAVR